MPQVRKSRRKTRKTRFQLLPILARLSRGRKYSNVLKDMMKQKKKLVALSRRIR